VLDEDLASPRRMKPTRGTHDNDLEGRLRDRRVNHDEVVHVNAQRSETLGWY
jgi:hypothetical protein